MKDFREIFNEEMAKVERSRRARVNGDPFKFFDWDKLRAYIKEHGPASVDAGLLGDWNWTAATVYEDGKFIEEHGAYLHSLWATPAFIATSSQGEETTVECWKLEDSDG